MYRLFSLWLAGTLLLPCCWGNQGTSEDEDYDVTPTPEYDYNSTFDYMLITFDYNQEMNYSLFEVMGRGKSTDWSDSATNKASGIGRLTPVLLLGLAVDQICQ
ncbi:uncharacterized protein ACJ7VT_021037 [Polymixia lowei]